MRRSRAIGPGDVLLAVSAMAAGHHAVLTASAWAAQASVGVDPPRPARPTHRFCILVPAHDEEAGIAATLAGFAALDYPGELVRVHVVADHCTDGTADVARSFGAEVHEHDDPLPRGKGPALSWLLARLEERGDEYDAAVFVDADSVVDPAFLRVADAHLAAGAVVVQSHYAVRDPGVSPVVAFRAAALAARHFLRPLGRARLGCSAGLFGNGMIFRRDVVHARAWQGHLTEDIEMHLELLLTGVVVRFAPDAIVEGEMPATLEAARSQHERWERGRLDIARTYVPELARRVVTGEPPGRVASADAAIDQIAPPLSLVAVLQAFVTAATALRWLIRRDRSARRRALTALACGAAHVVYVLSALRLTRAPRAVYLSLAQAPRMVLWKLALWLRVLGDGRDVSWTRTQRNEGRTT